MVTNLFIDLCTYLDSGGIGTSNKREPITFLTQWRMVGNSVIVESEGEVDNSILPEGYQLCEYIESHGTEYLSLGKDGLFTYEFKAQNVGDSSFKMIIGNGSGAAKYLAFRNGKWSLSSSVLSVADSTIPADVRVTFATDHIDATIGDEAFTLEGTNSVSYFYFFSYTSGNRNYNCSARVWYLKAYNGNTLVHDWIPCLDADGVPCMYDVIGKKAYYNRGEGTFDYKLATTKQIMSCGDLGDDGKYHVLILVNGKTIDIPLDEPLRKVGDVGDTIEFPTDAPNVGKVTRKVGEADLGDWGWIYDDEYSRLLVRYIPFKKTTSNRALSTIMTTKGYEVLSKGQGISGVDKVCYTVSNGTFYIHDSTILSADIVNGKCEKLVGQKIVFEIDAPTTSYIEVPQIPQSKNGEYQCGNVVPWSEFSFTEPNALLIDGQRMVADDGTPLSVKVGKRTFNID